MESENNSEETTKDTEEAGVAKAVQKLVSNGHAWSSIKRYTLAEIGVFLRVTIENEEDDKMNELTQMWMGNNLSQDGLNQVVHGIKHTKKSSTEKVKENKSEFRRLAQTMAGAK